MRNSKPFIVAEIAQGYEGSEKLVDLFVRTAAACGADAVKFQIFKAEELSMPDYQYYSLFKGLELPPKVWKDACEKAHTLGMEIFSDIFGTATLRQLESLGFDGYKVHTTDINNFGLLNAVARTKKKVFLSTGGCEKGEVQDALEILAPCQVTLMYGFQAEPTGLKDNNLNRLSSIRRAFELPLGFQDHTAGDSPRAADVSFVALGLGASVFEKHLTFTRPGQLEDFVSAMNPEEFKLWASCLKELHSTLGSAEWVLTEKERAYRAKVRRAVIADRTIAQGAVIDDRDLSFKRTAATMALFDKSRVLGRKAAVKIAKNMVITEVMLK